MKTKGTTFNYEGTTFTCSLLELNTMNTSVYHEGPTIDGTTFIYEGLTFGLYNFNLRGLIPESKTTKTWKTGRSSLRNHANSPIHERPEENSFVIDINHA